MSGIGDVLAGGVVRPVVEVTSWLAGAGLGAVDVAQGTVTLDVGADVLGQLELSVPATKGWIPSGPRHPLAAFGQQLIVRRGFAAADGVVTEWTGLGAYRVRSAVVEGGWVTVLADSVDVRLNLARWVVSTRTTGSFAGQARQICAGVVPIRVDAKDRASAARTWEQQQPRRESLLELCDAWGTALRMIDGQLVIVAAETGTAPAVTVTRETGLISVQPSADGDATPNVVVASSAPEDGAVPVSAMVAVESGPRAWTGPYGQVTAFFGSPLLTTRAACQSAAKTRLARLTAKATDVQITALTDPRIRPGMVVRAVAPDEDTDVTVRATRVRYALTPGQEPGEIAGILLAGRIKGVQW